MQQEKHNEDIGRLTDEHEINIIKKLRLFQATKDDHSTQNNKTKSDHDGAYIQFKIVHDALMRKTQDESMKDKIRLSEMNEAAKLSLQNKLESVSGKQYLTEKGFESVREK